MVVNEETLKKKGAIISTLALSQVLDTYFEEKGCEKICPLNISSLGFLSCTCIIRIRVELNHCLVHVHVHKDLHLAFSFKKHLKKQLQ